MNSQENPPQNQRTLPGAGGPNQRIVVMGVAGCGKTTVGQMLATQLGGEFLDGDGLHSEANIAKMSAGTPLNDSDRKPWLEEIGAELARAAANGRTLVIGCSALKRHYRDIIRSKEPLTAFVHLHGNQELLAQRLLERPGHFMPASLLESQLDTLEMLEPGEHGRLFDISAPVDRVAQQACQWLVANTV